MSQSEEERKRKKKKQESELEKMLLAILQKSLHTALQEAMKDIFKDFK